jgi:phosphatidate cytidylyltransferase
MSVSPPSAISSPTKLQVFGKRLISTLVLWALLAAALYYKVDWPFYILVGVLGLGSLWEFLKMDATLPKSSVTWVFLMGAIYYAGIFAHFSGVAISLELLDVLIGLLVLTGVFVPAFFKPLEGQKTLWHIMLPAFAFFYIAYLFSFLPRIIFTTWDAASPHNGMIYALFVVVATKFTDSGAYAVGSLIGKHKMIPHISPGKTWEGLSGAFLGAILAGLATKWFAGAQMERFGMLETILLCAAIAAICVAGDLAESLIKRCLGVKDSGKTLPGIGGAFDLTDSLLWTVPPFYLYLVYAS